MFLAKIYISLKPTVNDPQGLTIQGALHNLGFNTVAAVRAGKYIEIRIQADSIEQAQKQIQEMCIKLLSNPVIETYRFDIENC
jgi:phosphoribosylformylglycinamidine synthase PurS subunit